VLGSHIALDNGFVDGERGLFSEFVFIEYCAFCSSLLGLTDSMSQTGTLDLTGTTPLPFRPNISSLVLSADKLKSQRFLGLFSNFLLIKLVTIV